MLAVCGAALSLSGCSRLNPTAASQPLTTVAKVRKLPVRPSAPVPIRFRGVVTYLDPSLQQVYLQDSTGGARAEGYSLDMPLGAGFAVELEGTALEGGVSPTIALSRVVSWRRGDLPEPVRATADDLASGRLQYSYVEIQGVVRAAAIDHSGRLVLTVRVKDRDVEALMTGVSGRDYERYVDAEVRVRGALAASVDVHGQVAQLRMFVPARQGVAVVVPARDAEAIPLGTVGGLFERVSEGLPLHRVRLRGSVRREGGEYILRDLTGWAALRPAQGASLQTGDAAEAIGFAAVRGGQPALEECANPGEKPQGGVELRTLTRVVDVHRLSEGEASRAYPVRLRAVVTFFNIVGQGLVVQDETDGIYVWVGVSSIPRLRAGDLIELQGVSAPGDFAPIVTSPRIRILGRQELPKPLALDMDRLFTGASDSQWVEARGVVCSLRAANGMTMMAVRAGMRRFDVMLANRSEAPRRLLYARVTVRGVFGPLFNRKRQFLGAVIRVPGIEFIREESSAAPPSGVTRNIGELLQFAVGAVGDEPSRIRGTVTLAHPAGPTYVSDSTGGVTIENHSPVNLAIGDVVEAIGFAEAGPFSPVLRDAEIRNVGRAAAATPPLLTVEDIFEGDWDAKLLSIDAAVVERISSGAQQRLVLQAGRKAFSARLQEGELPALDKGAVVRVTGVALLEAPEMGRMASRGFSLLLRSPADVVLTRNAPWWNAQRALQLIAVVGVVALLAFAWIVVLRRRVRLQTRDLRRAKDAAEAASRAKGEFLANMSHEIRTPMNGVLGMTELALDTEMTAEQREYLSMAKASADALLELLNDILDFSKIEAGKLDLEERSFPLRETVAEIVRPLEIHAARKGLKLTSELDRDLPGYVVGDPTRLRQVIVNLLANGMKFTHEGEVSLRAERESEADGGVTVHFWVQDTGIGIAPDKQQAIFEAFTQADGSVARRFGGTGLGLSIASHLVGKMGGRMWVESEVGRGSVFHFTVRLGAGAAPAAESRPVPKDAGRTLPLAKGGPARPLTVLLAEDNAINQRLTARILEKMGHTVTLAADGVEAVEAFGRQTFDAVLMDVQMPVMDGYQATAAIRAREKSLGCRRTPVIAVTANVMKGDRERSLEAGMDHYISKPVRLEELRETLATATAPQESPAPK
jgi:signal transduction histidine kinase/ActR/RegA family two-component response regulator